VAVVVLLVGCSAAPPVSTAARTLSSVAPPASEVTLTTSAGVAATVVPTAITEEVATAPATGPIDSGVPIAAPTLVPITPPVSEIVASQPGTALPDGTIPLAGPPVVDASCDDTSRPDPLPAPGSARSQEFFRSFRTPLAPAPLYDPPGPRRVGLQAGHWLNEEVPPELGRLQGGAVGGGKQEWQVNLDVAQRTAALLETAGVQVDVLPATVPPRYRANAFIALHADGDPAGQARGFKVARPGFSSLPDVDDRLVDALNQVYAADTELPRDDEHISLRMRYYYAFNSRRYCHAVAPGVPQAIIELGYLTSSVDRGLLIGDPDKLARGVANGVQAFLSTLP
jgi:hypothetical protein